MQYQKNIKIQDIQEEKERKQERKYAIFEKYSNFGGALPRYFIAGNRLLDASNIFEISEILLYEFKIRDIRDSNWSVRQTLRTLALTKIHTGV